jgi:hypothetical protein
VNSLIRELLAEGDEPSTHPLDSLQTKPAIPSPIVNTLEYFLFLIIRKQKNITLKFQVLKIIEKILNALSGEGTALLLDKK